MTCTPETIKKKVHISKIISEKKKRKKEHNKFKSMKINEPGNSQFLTKADGYREH